MFTAGIQGAHRHESRAYDTLETNNWKMNDKFSAFAEMHDRYFIFSD